MKVQKRENALKPKKFIIIKIILSKLKNKKSGSIHYTYIHHKFNYTFLNKIFSWPQYLIYLETISVETKMKLIGSFLSSSL